MARENQQYDQARAVFHEALQKSSDLRKEDKITEKEHLNHKVFIYDQIANMLLDTGDFKNAERVFKDTLQLCLQLGMPENDNAIVEMMLKLATIYMYSGKIALGVRGVRECIDVQEKKLASSGGEKKDKEGKTVDAKELAEVETNTKVLLGKSYKHYAMFYTQQRHWKQAKELLWKAHALSVETLGEADDNSFIILNDIATIELMEQNYVAAEEILRDGIVKSGKAKSVVQSAFYSNLGALYLRTSRLDDAEVACKKGLNVARRMGDQVCEMPNKACLIKIVELRKQSGQEAQEKEDAEEEEVVKKVNN